MFDYYLFVIALTPYRPRLSISGATRDVLPEEESPADLFLKKHNLDPKHRDDCLLLVCSSSICIVILITTMSA
jgi:hypothetical protein